MRKKGSQGLAIARGTGDGLYVACPEEPFAAGDRVEFAVREDEESAKRLEKSVAAFTDDGRAYIHLTVQDTLSLEAGSYVYGVNIQRAGAEPVALIRSAPFAVEEAVARDE